LTIERRAETGDTLRTDEHEPECGEDFCDVCGDCLACYGGDPCCPDGTDRSAHRWIRHESAAASMIAVLRGPWTASESNFATADGTSILDNPALMEAVVLLPEICESLQSVAQYRVFGDNQRGDAVVREAAALLKRIRGTRSLGPSSPVSLRWLCWWL
jgi:hypothetical protein